MFEFCCIAAPASKPAMVSAPIAVAPVAVPVVAKPTPLPISKNPLYDNSDDDLIAAAEAAEKQSTIQKKRMSRSSRSPSLSKSTLVSTSYKHNIEPLIEQDVIVLADESDEEFTPELTEKLKRRNTPTTKIVAGSDSRRKTLQTGPSITANYTSITQQTTTAEDAAAAYRRRYTTNTPIKPAKESDEDLLNRVETPYLSDFIRRLADLKAAPLPGSEKTVYDYRPSPSTTPAYRREYRSSVHREGLSSGSGNATAKVTAKANAKAKANARFAARSWKPNQIEMVYPTCEELVRLPLLILLGIFVAVFVVVMFFPKF